MVCDLVSDGDKCPVGFISFSNSCYQVNNTTLSRSEAAAECGTSHLADIRSNEVQKFAVGLLKKSGGGDAWFGLQKSKSLAWSDGSTLQPGLWYGITNDSGSICFRLEDHGSNGTIWDDAQACENTYRHVCEYEGTSTRQ